ncbi:MAG TPA: tetratricopeptide repeat protein [Acidobacteriaceae bacterium]|nr:tetratricopeptide repeat protein [Acidobacteriaceae bacterium]
MAPLSQAQDAPPSQSASASQRASGPKAPALIDATGPSVSLTDSEALFDIAVALNACGYNDGLAASNPIRARIRLQVNQAIDQSAKARDDRDQICTFIDQHHLANPGLDLAQYVSLGLYVTPPPDLKPSTDEADMPPDSTQVVGILPILRQFAQDIDLHLIWITDRAAYNAILQRLHDPLTQMINNTNIYLKMPAATYANRRFLVVIEPLLSPGQTNARIYGTNYVVVTSPTTTDKIRMSEVRHVYLHYMIEPLIYARSVAVNRFLPFLNIVQSAPLAFRYKEDISSLVVECLIRAVEARIMSTGIDLKPIPHGTPRSQVAAAYHVHQLALARDAAIRQNTVNNDMLSGFVLTQYFYSQLIQFEKSPVSLDQSIGAIVYGMDVPQEVGRIRHIEFFDKTTPDVVQEATPPPPSSLDIAEDAIANGKPDAAIQLTETALKNHTPDPARANFILARADLMTGRWKDAIPAFQQSIQLGHNPRLLAWSHIYLGQINDIQLNRAQAIAEYKAALAVRDGQPDTKQAAEDGLKKPFTLPGQPPPPVDDSSGSNHDSANTTSSSPAPAPSAPAPVVKTSSTPPQ